MFGEEFDVTL